ncbi:uncharacterized protein LOC111711205 [Eurytemora carolleeae]|uniref:uncharacterized protein LOC111711205 n=1 Tax=Eurytemora carolleeae TaxID=1294199 RepID=UPI000C7702F9|nr:uncharacterized protein LOC111711205 [Eurytemora carolleeae]|eukprot:XP_023341261.1 uncharacterized protein LOC111711205 [Eurytemora affinis]
MLGLFLTYLGIWSLTRLFSFNRNILPSFVLLSLHAGIKEAGDRVLYSLLISSFVFVAAGLSNVCTRRCVPVLLVPFLFMYTLLSFSHTRVNYEENPAEVRNWTLASAPKNNDINSLEMNETIHTHWALTVIVDTLHTPGALLGIENIVPSLLLIFSILLFSPYFLFCSVQGALISNLTSFFLSSFKEEISRYRVKVSTTELEKLFSCYENWPKLETFLLDSLNTYLLISISTVGNFNFRINALSFHKDTNIRTN